MTLPMRGLLVCQASDEVGLGHLSRMAVLAIAFQQQTTIQIDLVIQGLAIVQKTLLTINHQFLAPNDCLCTAILNLITISSPQFIVFDVCAKRIDQAFIVCLKQLRALNIKIIAIDSLDYAAYCDRVHIPAFWVDPAKLGLVSCPVFYGWDCYLLAEQNSKKSWQPGNKIMVLTGGSDVMHLGETWPCVLDQHLALGSEVHWVQGPYAKAPQLPKTLRLHWVVHVAPENILSLMAEMHYALTVFGVSFFELVQCGIPTVVFSPYGEKDQMTLTKINELELCAIAKNSVDAIQALMRLMMNDKMARLFSIRSLAALAGNGADKLIYRIQLLMNKL